MAIDVNPQSAYFEKVALPVLKDGNLMFWAQSASNIPDDLNATQDYVSLHGSTSLLDYLGAKGVPVSDTVDDPGTARKECVLNIFPFLAYHRTIDKFYKNPLVQCPAFYPVPRNDDSLAVDMLKVGSLPWVCYTANGSDVYTDAPFDLSLRMFDGVRLGELRQRNFGADYFTSATPTPQLGDAPELSMQVSDSSAGFTIGELRAINSMTRFVERNNLSGTDWDNWLRSRGSRPKSETLEPVYLGHMNIDVYSNAVTQTSNASGATTQNPFESVGARYGMASAAGENDLIDDFEVEQPGYILVLVSLVPKVTYGTGMRRYLKHFTENGCRADIADSLLENVGPQPIYQYELDSKLAYDEAGNVENADPTSSDIFGYTDRYAEFKAFEDELHGLMRDGESLQSFALQRDFDGAQEISDSFLQIPDTYLDQVAAVDGDISRYGCWCDFYFDYKVVQPLSSYSVPSLVDPAALDGHWVDIRRNGVNL